MQSHSDRWDGIVRIVHVNVRLSEGGAAGVALDLHSRSLQAGYASRFFYGYGSGARPSVYEAEVEGARHLGSRIRVGLNYASHRLCGMEFIAPGGENAKALREAVRNADVVHLHAIHSFFAPFGWLAEVLQEARHIVWTCHDFWPITGRCAFLEGCEGWKNGCGGCSTGSNYPPSVLDFSAYTFKKRRELIGRQLERIVFVAPSRFVAEQFRQAFPGARVEVIYNGIDRALEQALVGVTFGHQADEPGRPTRVLAMANDLSDPTKIDRAVVGKLLAIEGIELHTIGKNSPFGGANVVNHGSVRERPALVKLMRDMDALLFTSLKDTFGLVMIEAMVCGVPVLALPSDAADEVLGAVGQPTLEAQEIMRVLQAAQVSDSPLREMKERLSGGALSVFSGQSMFDQYCELYREAGRR